MPSIGPAPFDAVASSDPVTLGLAAATKTPVHSPDACAGLEGRILVDWSPGTADAAAEAAKLDALVADLRCSGDRSLVDGGGNAWICDRSALRRFWKRAVSLREALGQEAE